jgi:signal transduction histidine kinase
MEEITRLNEAFHGFTTASKSLEAYYDVLRERVRYLTIELEDKNRQLQEALFETEEAEDYLHGILESLREAIVVVDPDWHVTMMNKAAEELLGVYKDYAIGKPFHALDFSIEAEGADMVLYARGGRTPVIVSGSDVLDSEGFARGHVILLQDIARLRELEAEQERNHRLIAMGEMAAKIVHQIRSPLCSIELYASMLARDLEGTPHMNLAQGISTGIKSLNNVLTNMHFFAKPQKPALRVTQLGGVLDEVVFMLMPLIEGKVLSLRRTGASTATIACDAELLKQVFLNIILNAIQATPEGGSMEVGIQMKDGYAVVEVTDEGEGIERERLEKIFDPFYSTKEKGTGLGLAIAAKIMQAHSGTIRVKSREGQGSCFQLYLPSCPERVCA